MQVLTQEATHGPLGGILGYILLVLAVGRDESASSNPIR